LGDGSLHLADSALRGAVELNEGAVLAVLDEGTAGLALLGDVDELVNGTRAGPGCFPS
jgi:hypothetical protein